MVLTYPGSSNEGVLSITPTTAIGGERYAHNADRCHVCLTKPPACALRPVIPINACTLRITAAAGTELAGEVAMQLGA